MEQIKQHKFLLPEKNNKLPVWLTQNDNYNPCRDRDHFIDKTLLALTGKLTLLKNQPAMATDSFFSASFKLICTIVLILLISLSHRLMFPLIVLAVFLTYLACLDSRRISSILKPVSAAMFFSLCIVLPAFISGQQNTLMLPLKVFLTTMSAAFLAQRTAFSALTKALGGLHVPGLFIMVLDLTLKYIILLGNTAADLLIALRLRSIGKNDRKYKSMGSIMGMVFLKANEYSIDTHNAMLCRCFTGDYHVSQKHRLESRYFIYMAIILTMIVVFLYAEEYL
ncbi:energy-coupling factor transporter transmembrane component T [Pectinatus haikarae]|uniref:energy-coupling factor transporter transmembrane component T n=1 Tax=Pectinatus haikarae TaxID=349096 RepID=UPI0018C7659E